MIRAREALGKVHLTPMERILLGILADHDLTRYRPSEGILAKNLYGRDDRRTRDETRKLLRRLEDAGELKTTFMTDASGRRTYNDYVVGDGASPSDESSSDGSLLSSDGSLTSSDGRTQGTKSKKGKKTNSMQGKNHVVPASPHPSEYSKSEQGGWERKLGVPGLKSAPFDRLIYEDLVPVYGAETVVDALHDFRVERVPDALKADNPAGWVMRVLPLWIAENYCLEDEGVCPDFG